MNPPYYITPEILNLLTTVSEKLGAIRAARLDKPTPQLRKHNQIRTIHNSLAIEGNTMRSEQVTAIIEGKSVVGPVKDIQEVKNAIAVYAALDQWNPFSEQSFLRAHNCLMEGLIAQPGVYRTSGVGIVKGSEVQHFAPPQHLIPTLMEDLFNYLKHSQDHILIKSCVFHYELEFIHPFMDGNGRMGRLWQSVILCEKSDLFSSLPFESIIKERQQEYYAVLNQCDRVGKSTNFISFMLSVLSKAMDELIAQSEAPKTLSDRLSYFTQTIAGPFTRKQYLATFPGMSTATASRDLKAGVERGVFQKFGDRNKTYYEVIKAL